MVIERGVWQQVASELLDGELIKGQIGIEGAHQPVAIRPDRARLVGFIALRIRVTGQVEPDRSPALAEARRFEQAVHNVLMGCTAAGEG